MIVEIIEDSKPKFPPVISLDLDFITYVYIEFLYIFVPICDIPMV